MWRKQEEYEKQQMCFLHGELSFEEKMLRFVVHFNQSVSYNWANNSEIKEVLNSVSPDSL